MDKLVHDVTRSAINQHTFDNWQNQSDLPALNPGSTTSDIEKLIFAQAIDFVYNNQLSIIYISILMQLATVIAMWQHAKHTLLISWIIASFAALAWRYVLVLSYQKKASIDSPQRWGYYYAAVSFMSGLLWGSATYLFFVPGSVTNQVLLIAMSIGLTVGSLAVNSYYLPSFFMVAAPILFATMSRLFIEPDIEYQGMVVLLLAYFGFVVKNAKNTNKTIIDAFRLRFENLDLITQLREQKMAAEEANLAKSKFLAAASHDLRQPLHALSLFTALLDSTNDKQKQQDLINKINRSQTALSSLLNTLLDVSKLDAGIVEARLCDFDLDNMFKHLIPEFEAQGCEKGLHLNYTATHFVVHSDPALLEIILRNIISNAIHYTEKGGITVQVHKVETSTQPAKIKIEITDTGIGIPENKQKEIFLEFHQLANPERNRAKGLGLGLAIVRRVCELLKHDIELKSKTGEGSTFFISLSEGDSSQVITTVTPELSSKQYDFPGTVVLFIDDEQEIREGMQQTLNQWGCETIVASSADEAVLQIKTQGFQPDVILADYRLQGGKNGADAIHQINIASGREVPALIITGDTAPERLREARDSGYTLLHKPLQPAQIRAFIRNAVYPPDMA